MIKMNVSKIFRGFSYFMKTIISKIRYGNKLKVDGKFRKRFDTQIIISGSGKMHFAKNVSFQRNVSLSAVGGVLNVGTGVSFNRNCIVICRKEIQIGNHVIFGPGVTIYDHDHIFSDEGILHGYKQDSVVIDDGCWIAANVTILRNTHIGKGCVIGAGTLVKGDIPPYSLVTNDRSLNVVPIVKKIRLNR